MNERYQRNRIFLNDDHQRKIKSFKIVLCGCGIGSVIAECALRLGFENFILIDGDIVEKSNLNRQNYNENDLKKYKVDALKRRLLSINNNAVIKTHNCYLTEENLNDIFEDDFKVVVNALDFSTAISLKFDEICIDKNLIIIHPFNLGYAGLITIISPESKTLNSISDTYGDLNEIIIVDYFLNKLTKENSATWLIEILEQIKNEINEVSPPQLSIGCWMVSSMCTNLLLKIATNEKFKEFPEFYYNSVN
jgi:tRNA A37 threonylcarbamoyladenosine dehydratase